MTVRLFCAMCGKSSEYEIDPKKLDLTQSLKTFIESQLLKGSGHWFTQQNGPHVDIYCSRKCAA